MEKRLEDAERAMYAANTAVREYDSPVKAPDGSVHPDWDAVINRAKAAKRAFESARARAALDRLPPGVDLVSDLRSARRAIDRAISVLTPTPGKEHGNERTSRRVFGLYRS